MDIMKWYEGVTDSYEKLQAVLQDDKGGLLGFNFSPHAGYIYIIAEGNTASRVIHVKKASGSFKKPVPFKERPYKFRFEYDTITPLKDALKVGLVPLATYEVDMRALGEEKEKDGDIQKMALVRIVEPKRTYILRNSICAFMVDVFDTNNTGMRFFFKYSMNTKPSKAISIRERYPEGNEHLIAAGMMRKLFEEKLSEKNQEDLRGISKNGLGGIIDEVLTAINTALPEGLCIEWVVKAFEVPFKKAQEMFDAKADVIIQEQKNIVTVNAGIAEATSIKNKGVATNAVALDKEKTVGAAAVANLGKALKELELYQQATSAIVNKNQVKVAKQLGKLTTYVAGNSGVVGEDPMVTALKAQAVLRQQQATQGNAA